MLDIFFFCKYDWACLKSSENFYNILYSNVLPFGLIHLECKIVKTTKIYKVRKTNEAKLKINLTSIQKEVVIGTVLGDSSIERAKPNHNSRIRYDQSFPEHATYLIYLFGGFNNLCKKGPKVFIRKPDILTGKVYSHISFKTLNLLCLNEFYELFYKDKKKIIPLNIADLLTPRALAFWIMDDGSKIYPTQNALHTLSYTYSEVLLLQQALYSNFKLKSSLFEKTPNQWIIIIPIKQEVSLKEIVMPYMHYTFLYKL